MNLVTNAGAVLAAMALSSVASAATLTLDDFTGEWKNPVGAVPGAPVNYTSNGLGNNPEARWGEPVAGSTQQSGYLLDMAPTAGGITAPVIQNFDVPGSSDYFAIGTFTHFNWPILPGGSIASIDMTVSFNINLDGNDLGYRSFDFRFNHLESNNLADPCANGEPNGVDLNVNGCADRVTISYLSTSEKFLVDGVLYTFDIVGFSGNDCETFCTEFWTIERQDNSANLYARIRAVETPEPGTLALFGLGLLGLGMTNRRKA
jgi:hypothetical protein